MKFPQSGIWKSAPGLEYFADIIRSRGVDLLTPGFLGLANKPIQLYSSGDSANFSRIVAIVPDTVNSLYYLMTTDRVYVIGLTGAVTLVDNTNMPDVTGGSDAVFFNGKATVSGTNTVKDVVGNTWTDRMSGADGLSASYPILLEVFENKNQLAIANGNTVYLKTTAWAAGTATLTIPSQFVISTMRWFAGNLYIGTRHQYGGRAKMFVWNGGTSDAQQGYDVGSEWVYSMEPFDGSIIIVTSAGLLRRFNGGGFTTSAELPVYRTSYSWKSNASVAASSFGNVPHRGMTANGDTLYLNLKGDLNQNSYDFPGPYLADQPSGVWTYTTANGLSHYMGYGNKKYRTLTISAVASSYLVLGGVTHKLQTGDPVYANSVSNITGITSGHLYFAIVEETDTLKLALSQADALNGNALTLSGTASSDTICVDDTSSIGATYDATTGAICAISTPFSNTFFGTEILFGGEPIDATGTTIHSLYSCGRQASIATFVTTPITAGSIKDTFRKLYTTLKDFHYAADRMEVKYRSIPRAGLPTPIRTGSAGFATWTSASVFTIDTTAKDFKSAAIGDEVDIISGSSAGHVGHITAISISGNTYTVTLDRSIPGITAADVSEVVVEDWKLLSAISTSTENVSDGFCEIPVGKIKSLLQFKVVLYGYGVRIRYLDAITAINKPAV